MWVSVVFCSDPCWAAADEAAATIRAAEYAAHTAAECAEFFAVEDAEDAESLKTP
jgi:hypothetical protein